MEKIIVVAPHPDDETLACGGTLLHHREKGDEIHWLIMTDMREELGYSQEVIRRRQQEIQEIRSMYAFTSVKQLSYATTQLDQVPMSELIQSVSDYFRQVQASILYLPFSADIHSDHQITFNVCIACSKQFRYPSINRILTYEAISETDYVLDPAINKFQPNVFVDISSFLEKKLRIMEIYASELADFPFPRSTHAIKSLAALRGSQIGVMAAESFMLLKERIL